MKKLPAPLRDETLDTLLQGKLSILQGKRGYRFSLDALLLAHFVKPHGRGKIIDLGTGNGVIACILAFLHPAARVIGLEIQEEMVDRALRSVALNGLGDRVEIVQGDVCSIERMFSPRSFDAVVCNPPYRGQATGRISPDPERRIARHEIEGGLDDFIRAGSYVLRHRGAMAVIYSAPRALALLEKMRREGLEPKRLRFVHSFAAKDASLVLVEGVKGGRSELKISPPVIVYAERKKYTSEMRAILAGEAER
jgi:tRNA1Val (adenine37-N6)-methyltransferase